MAKKKVTTKVEKVEEEVVDSDGLTQAFIAGFQKGVDVMFPIIMNAVKKTQDNVYDLGVQETLSGLEGTIKNRVEKALHGHHKKANRSSTGKHTDV